MTLLVGGDICILYICLINNLNQVSSKISMIMMIINNRKVDVMIVSCINLSEWKLHLSQCINVNFLIFLNFLKVIFGIWCFDIYSV